MVEDLTTAASRADLERDLMRQAMAGSAEAYGRLFEIYRPAIYRLAYGMLHDAAAAEDAAQETFLKGLDKISSFRGECTPKGWLISIGINECRHRLRELRWGVEQAGDRTLDAGKRLWRPRTKGAVSKAVQREDHRLLAIAMGYLTDSQREVFLLHYAQGLDYDEIGQILGIRSGAARALAHRAKASLRDKLGSEVWITKQA
jgi:RNA polymerase sigma-70 factor (ECF subfamily)